ncbi:MAG TPA: hypothetical protein VF776_04915 [Sphingomicrobium sp.]
MPFITTSECISVHVLAGVGLGRAAPAAVMSDRDILAFVRDGQVGEPLPA